MLSQLQRIERLEQQLDAWKFRVEALEAEVKELREGAIHKENQEFYTVREVATVLALNEQIVRRHIRDGRIKATNVGKEGNLTRWRVSKVELERFKAGEEKFKAIDEAAMRASNGGRDDPAELEL